MGLREKLNQNQGIVIGALVVLVILLVVFSYVTLRPQGGVTNGSRWLKDKEFFSDNEGHNYFVDDSSKIPPFQHNNRPAYRAAVFMDSNGQKFAGYLESYDPDTKAKIENEIKSGKPAANVLSDYLPNVKKPGGNWVKPKNGRATPEYKRVLEVTSRDKKVTVTKLHVTEQDLKDFPG